MTISSDSHLVLSYQYYSLPEISDGARNLVPVELNFLTQLNVGIPNRSYAPQNEGFEERGGVLAVPTHADGLVNYLLRRTYVSDDDGTSNAKYRSCIRSNGFG